MFSRSRRVRRVVLLLPTRLTRLSLASDAFDASFSCPRRVLPVALSSRRVFSWLRFVSTASPVAQAHTRMGPSLLASCEGGRFLFRFIPRLRGTGAWAIPSSLYARGGGLCFVLPFGSGAQAPGPFPSCFMRGSLCFVLPFGSGAQAPGSFPSCFTRGRGWVYGGLCSFRPSV